jgi:hypothetical protein
MRRNVLNLKIVSSQTLKIIMKKIVFILVFAITAFTSYAQTKIAIKGGVNYSGARVYFKKEIANENIKQPSDYKTGFGLGVHLELPFEGALFFNPSFMYNMRGYTYTPTYGDTTKYDNTIHYFDISPMLSVHTKQKGKGKFVVSAGPVLGFALSGTEKTTTNNITTSKKMKFAFSGGYGAVDLGLKGGIGFQTNKVLIEAQYYYGAANINNRSEFDHRNIQNRMFSLNIGYFIK